MSAHRLVSIFVPVTFVAAALVGCLGSSSSSPSPTATDLPAAIKAPCSGAELHQRHPYTACVNGFVNQMADDLWCCPDMSMPTTNTTVAVTTEACGDAADAGAASTPDDGGTVSQTPKCGQMGSGCDDTVCGQKVDGGFAGNCTTKYGECQCVVTGGNCTISSRPACVDNGCSASAGTCTLYTKGLDTGCICVK